MESFPWLAMFYNKHTMACNGPWMAACQNFQFQQDLDFLNLRNTYLKTLFTEVAPLKKKLSSSPKRVLFRCLSSQYNTFWWGNPNEVLLIYKKSNFQKGTTFSLVLFIWKMWNIRWYWQLFESVGKIKNSVFMLLQKFWCKKLCVKLIFSILLCF